MEISDLHIRHSSLGMRLTLHGVIKPAAAGMYAVSPTHITTQYTYSMLSHLHNHLEISMDVQLIPPIK